MSHSKQAKEVDVSEELGYYPTETYDQIRGKLFPNSKVRTGTRWIYVVLLLIALGVVLFEAVTAVMILTTR